MISNFKDPPYRSSAWLACVRLLGYCVRCGAICQPQACHRDQGKGMGIKAHDCYSWAGCDPCHVEVGNGKTYGRDERRAVEKEMSDRTVLAMAKRGFLKPDPKAENRNILR